MIALLAISCRGVALNSHLEDEPMVDRIVATPEALGLLERLKTKHGSPLLFVQSCGGCDHSSAYCYKASEYHVGPHDQLVGEVGGVPYYLDASQHELFRRTQILIRVVPGDRSGDMSLEGTEGVIFRMESRLFTDAECAELEEAGVV
jgi:uncharacterized protein (DUF779 family)